MTRIAAETCLTSAGWRRNITVDISPDGRIAKIDEGSERADHYVGVLLPSPGNLHSHAFQRALAGLGESRGPGGRDSFWTWRELMYRFLGQLTPEDVEAIAAQVQVEMLEAGYAAIGEFHYLHHGPDGTPFSQIGEMSSRIAAAAGDSGIGLTLLPVLYSQGGIDGRPLAGGQRRFGNTPSQFETLWQEARAAVSGLSDDAVLGVAPHSLRAVSAEGIAFAEDLVPGAPIHIHVAEQTAEVDEIKSATGARPVEWLMDCAEVGPRWCLIHATHMTPAETEAMARSGAIAGLCPITESNLGDGIFDGARFLTAGGSFGIGSDSNLRIALTEELRTLEYSQRLRDRARAVLAETERSSGRCLFEGMVRGGAQALGRGTGLIAAGNWADLVALDADALSIVGLAEDTLLDGWIFAGDDRAVTDVWSAGRHMVREGRHIRRDGIEARFRDTLAKLRAAL